MGEFEISLNQSNGCRCPLWGRQIRKKKVKKEPKKVQDPQSKQKGFFGPETITPEMIEMRVKKLEAEGMTKQEAKKTGG